MSISNLVTAVVPWIGAHEDRHLLAMLLNACPQFFELGCINIIETVPDERGVNQVGLDGDHMFAGS